MLCVVANGDKSNKSIEFLAADLASGDGRSLELDRIGLEVARIQTSRDPLLGIGYEKLWGEFGAQHEMESREVIEQRLAWNPVKRAADCWMCYEMFLVRHQDRFAAVRDHTAIVTCRSGTPHAVMHLSHILIDPAWRRTGLAGWLRAWPIQTGRACLAAAGFPVAAPMTLVLEMESPDAGFEKAMIRLKAYEKAGFKKVDSSAINYFQPDFRPPQEIDAGGGPHPLPFNLLVRRIGREDEPFVRGAEVREIVECLYRMYGAGCREKDMEGLWKGLNEYPVAEAKVALVEPSR
jgi:GNAT superfamily N-acetyltransferase